MQNLKLKFIMCSHMHSTFQKKSCTKASFYLNKNFRDELQRFRTKTPVRQVDATGALEETTALRYNK